MREAVGGKADLLLGTHGQFTTSGRHPAREAARAVRSSVVRGTGAAGDAGANGQGRARHQHSDRHRRAADHQVRIRSRSRRGRRQHPADELGRVGGLLEAKKVAALAEVHYAQIAPHLYCGPVVGAANIQIATCTPNFLIWKAFSNGADSTRRS